MTELYFRLVKAKIRTCNRENTEVRLVPDEHLEDVMHLLDVEGYDADGNKVMR